jgi:hypothetical protein
VAESGRSTESQNFFDQLDKVVAAADVRDVSAFLISGFPYLRANRFLASFKDQLTNDPQKAQWIRWMQQLDLEARKKEIFNLPPEHFKNLTTRLGEPLDRGNLYHRVTIYSDQLLRHDQRPTTTSLPGISSQGMSSRPWESCADMDLYTILRIRRIIYVLS